MFPLPTTAFDVQELRRQDALADAGRARLAARCGTTSRRLASAVAAVPRTVGAILGRVGALAHDSGEGLRSKEQELAAQGLTWAADPAYEQALAEELEATRLRRAAGPAVLSVAA